MSSVLFFWTCRFIPGTMRSISGLPCIVLRARFGMSWMLLRLEYFCLYLLILGHGALQLFLFSGKVIDGLLFGLFHSKFFHCFGVIAFGGHRFILIQPFYFGLKLFHLSILHDLLLQA